MRTFAKKQPKSNYAKQKKKKINKARSTHRSASRSLSVSPFSIEMPFLQRKCACGGSCPRCKENLGIQTKLKIGEPEDKYEQEADRIADQVMRIPEPSVQGQVEPEEKDRVIQTKAIAVRVAPLTRTQESSEVPNTVHEVLNSPGQPLTLKTRNFMESHFGHDFNLIRVHTDTKAAKSAAEMNAEAYTVKHNIVFATGRYAPDTQPGRQLLAHELTHVVQQSSARSNVIQTKPEVSQLEEPAEQELPAIAKIPEAPRFWQIPPGPGAYTLEEYRKWLKRYSERKFHASRDIDTLTPEWFWDRGYFYAGKGGPGAKKGKGLWWEVWLSNLDKGKEIRLWHFWETQESERDVPSEAKEETIDPLEPDSEIADAEEEDLALLERLMKDFEQQLPGFSAEVELLEKRATEIMERGESPGKDVAYCVWKKDFRKRVNKLSSIEHINLNGARQEMVFQDPNRPRTDEIKQKLKDYEKLIEGGLMDIRLDLNKLPECELPP